MKNIFISSTFEDLNDIRDYISRNIRTPLNDFAAMFGEEYKFTDLRLGIENKINTYETICDCLSHLKKAAPPLPFISILGDRYGWVPEEDVISDAKDYLGQKKGYAQIIQSLDRGEKGISITQMEINYGAYGMGCQKKEDCSKYHERSIFIVAGEAPEEKQRALIQKIERDFPGQVIYLKDYAIDGASPLENPALRQTLLGKCIKILSLALEETNLAPEELERKLHENYMVLKASGFYGRKTLLSQVKSSLFAPGKPNTNFTYIHGESGIGKSSFLSKTARQLQRKIDVFPIFCGLTKNSDSAREILESIANHLKSKLPSYAKAETDPVDEYNRICALYDACETTSPLLIVIDAIDQLRPDAYSQTLAFLPRRGYEKIFILFSGTYDREYVESKIFTFKNKDIATFEAYKLKEIKSREISGIVKGIFSTELRVGDVSKTLCKYLVENNITNPLYLAIILQKLSLMSIEEMRHTQAGGRKETKFTREEAMIHIIEPLVHQNLDTLCVQFFKSWSSQYDNRFFDIARYIAESRHGLPISIIKKLFGEDFDEELFYVFCFSLNRFFVKRRDGSIDFTHKCLRNALTAYTREQRETTKLHKDIFKILKTEEESPFKDTELCYHALLSENISFIYRYVAQNTPRATETQSKKELKNNHLKSLAEIIQSVDYIDNLFPYFRWGYEEKPIPTIAFLQFCLDVLPESFSISFQDSKKLLNIFEDVVIVYSFPLLTYEKNRERSYLNFMEWDQKEDSPFDEAKYYTKPPVKVTVKKAIADYCPSSLVYGGISAAKKAWDLRKERKYQFGFDQTSYGENTATDLFREHIEPDLFKKHIDLFSCYVAHLYEFYESILKENNHPLTRQEIEKELWEKISMNPIAQRIINDLNQSYYFRYENNDGKPSDYYNFFYECTTAQILGHENENGLSGLLMNLLAKENAPEEMLKTLLLAEEKCYETEQLFTEPLYPKVKRLTDPEIFEKKRKILHAKTDSNKISDVDLENYVVFLQNHIEQYDELNEPKKSREERFAFYQESYDFLCDYLRYYGFHRYACNALKKCIDAAEKAGVPFEVSKEYRLGAARLLTNMIDLGFTHDPSLIMPFFSFDEEAVQLTDSQKDEMEFAQMEQECAFLKKNMTNVLKTSLSMEYVHLFRSFLQCCSQAFLFCMDHADYKQYATQFKKNFYGLLDEFLFFYERNKLVSPNEKLIPWILERGDLVFTKQKAFKPYKEDLLSLQQYAKAFRHIGYTNEQGIYVWDTWEWKRKTRKNK